ncbi:hypothetical protein TrVE_jg11808 [Triparma verrucosa]|uniref:Uncharacterized protein n=1 Tax=Triparma verrucosa TaxID=1606542 RepID=A0A9W7KVH6_9STRA|nr:hypothetical protein TrVE_jg11808 [Triparma verrucosa]
MANVPFASDVASLYDSFKAEDAVLSYSLLFGNNQGMNQSFVYESWEDLNTDRKYQRWLCKKNYSAAIQRAALQQATLPASEWIKKLTREDGETLRYREFDEETNLPTHDWKGDLLTRAQILTAKKDFRQQQKLFEERQWKCSSWDESQPGVHMLKKRNVLLELRSNVRKWDLERRRIALLNDNLPPKPEDATILKNAFERARKYDTDRRNAASAKKTMLAMLAAENKLDELLVTLDKKDKEKNTTSLPENEKTTTTTNDNNINNNSNNNNKPEANKENSLKQTQTHKHKYGKIDPSIPSKRFDPNPKPWLKWTSTRYEVFRTRRDKSHNIVDTNREKQYNLKRTQKPTVKSKLKTRWLPPPPI